MKTFAVLNFTYTSANEVVDIDYVRVRKPDGTVVKTPDYNIQDMPGGSYAAPRRFTATSTRSMWR